MLFGTSLFAEFIANDRPLLIRFDGHWYVPVLQDYSEDTFGAEFMPTEADYTDPDLQQLIEAHGWMIWPAIPYSLRTPRSRTCQARRPRRRLARNLLGTDDQARDVLARVIYGLRLSVLFGFTLTAVTSVVGIVAGAVQGYYGGLTDLLFQRFIEIWNGMPELYLLIILAQHHHAELLGAADLPAAVPLDEPDRAWCAPNSCAAAIWNTCARRRRSACPTSP